MRFLCGLFLTAIFSTHFARADPPEEFKLFDKAVRALAIAPNGKTLAASGDEGKIALWDLKTRKVVKLWKGHDAGIEGLTFHDDGKALISGSVDKTIGWWDIDREKPRQTIVAAGPVTDLCLSPNQKLLAVALEESQVLQILDSQSGKELQRLKLPVQHSLKGTKTSSRVTYSPDGSLLVASCGGRSWPKFVGGDSTISIWETSNWRLRTSFVASRYILHELAISPDGQYLAAATNRDLKVKVWKIPSAKQEIQADQKKIAELIKQLDDDNFFKRESAQSELIKLGQAARTELEKAGQSQSAEVRVRAKSILKGLQQESVVPQYTLGFPRFDVHTVAFSRDGKWLALGRQFKKPGHVALFNRNDDYRRFVAPLAHGAWVVLFTADSKKLLTGRSDGYLTLWDIPQSEK